MNISQPMRRLSRLQRAVALLFVVLVNTGIAAFIDRLTASGADADAWAIARPAVAALAV